MLKNGYTAYPLEDHPAHDVYVKNKIMFELHFELSGVPYGEIGKKVLARSLKINDNAVTVQYQGLTLSVPDYLSEAMIMLLHLQHHLFGEGVGIRHLCDVFAYLNSKIDGEHWIEMLDYLKQISLDRFMYILAVMGVEFFQLKADYLATPTDNDRKIVLTLLDAILDSGTFGVKDKTARVANGLISDRGKDGVSKNYLKRFMARVTHNTYVIFPVVKSKKILYPLFWCVVLFRQVWRVISKKTVINSNVLKKAEQNYDLFNELGLFRTQEDDK